MRTIKENFETLAEPYRTQAIKNEDPTFLDYHRYEKSNGRLSDAVIYGFDWEDTPEGQGILYWAKLHEILEALENQMNQPC